MTILVVRIVVTIMVIASIAIHMTAIKIVATTIMIVLLIHSLIGLLDQSFLQLFLS